MTTIARHHSAAPAPILMRPDRIQPLRRALASLRAAWRRGGDMSQSVEGLRDAAWSTSGNASHRLW
ncbi:hypothetical protein [Sinomonas sp.]|uniref:hypothetical protein n=1 Tax=Sinomonas sp. TaxID=1914986 RepID=UPI002FE38DFF